jgi:hypothetical protein
VAHATKTTTGDVSVIHRFVMNRLPPRRGCTFLPCVFRPVTIYGGVHGTVSSSSQGIRRSETNSQ